MTDLTDCITENNSYDDTATLTLSIQKFLQVYFDDFEI